jgi:hypothetical protein
VPDTQLFRNQAIAARFYKQGSAITIATPLSGRVLAIVSLAIVAILASVAAYGKLTRTVAVTGTLVPERSVIRIFSPQQGIVAAKRIRLPHAGVERAGIGLGDRCRRGFGNLSPASGFAGGQNLTLECCRTVSATYGDRPVPGLGPRGIVDPIRPSANRAVDPESGHFPVRGCSRSALTHDVLDEVPTSRYRTLVSGHVYGFVLISSYRHVK